MPCIPVCVGRDTSRGTFDQEERRSDHQLSEESGDEEGRHGQRPGKTEYRDRTSRAPDLREAAGREGHAERSEQLKYQSQEDSANCGARREEGVEDEGPPVNEAVNSGKCGVGNAGATYECDVMGRLPASSDLLNVLVAAALRGANAQQAAVAQARSDEIGVDEPA